MRLAFAFLILIACSAHAADAVLEEHFIINAQYRGGINKAFKDLGQGLVKYKGEASAFAVSIAGSMKNPENGDIYKMRVSGEFGIAGRAITKVSQKIDINNEARRYEKLMTENLPFVWMARFLPLPASPEAEDVVYTYDGREYRMRYVPLEDTTEGTLFQGQTQVGKFFLEGKGGQRPRRLTKARLIGPDHLVISLVIDRP